MCCQFQGHFRFNLGLFQWLEHLEGTSRSRLGSQKYELKGFEGKRAESTFIIPIKPKVSQRLTTHLNINYKSFTGRFSSFSGDFCEKKLVQSYCTVFFDFLTLCTGACKRNPDFFGVQKLIFVSTCSSRRGLSDKLNFQFRHPAFFQTRTRFSNSRFWLQNFNRNSTQMSEI